MKFIPVGTMVTFARTDHNEEGDTRIIPALVLGQWPNGALELYLFHFEGAPSYLREVPLTAVRMVGQSEPIEKTKSLIAV